MSGHSGNSSSESAFSTVNLTAAEISPDVGTVAGSPGEPDVDRNGSDSNPPVSSCARDPASGEEPCAAHMPAGEEPCAAHVPAGVESCDADTPGGDERPDANAAREEPDEHPDGTEVAAKGPDECPEASDIGHRPGSPSVTFDWMSVCCCCLPFRRFIRSPRNVTR